MMFPARFLLLFVSLCLTVSWVQSGFADLNLPIKRNIVLDAGSSGSRAMAYFMQRDPNSPLFDLIGQSQLIEDDPLGLDIPFGPETRGFFQYYTRQSLYHFKSRTDIFLGATAGMRALQGSLSLNILQQKVDELNTFGALAQYNKNVKLFAWPL